MHIGKCRETLKCVHGKRVYDMYTVTGILVMQGDLEVCTWYGCTWYVHDDVYKVLVDLEVCTWYGCTWYVHDDVYRQVLVDLEVCTWYGCACYVHSDMHNYRHVPGDIVVCAWYVHTDMHIGKCWETLICVHCMRTVTCACCVMPSI